MFSPSISQAKNRHANPRSRVTPNTISHVIKRMEKPKACGISHGILSTEGSKNSDILLARPLGSLAFTTPEKMKSSPITTRRNCRKMLRPVLAFAVEVLLAMSEFNELNSYCKGDEKTCV